MRQFNSQSQSSLKIEELAIEESTRAAVCVLRRVASWQESLPPSRLFSAITSLIELSTRIEQNLEAGCRALAEHNTEVCELSFAKASALSDMMSSVSNCPNHQNTPLSDNLRRQITIKLR